MPAPPAPIETPPVPIEAPPAPPVQQPTIPHDVLQFLQNRFPDICNQLHALNVHPYGAAYSGYFKFFRMLPALQEKIKGTGISRSHILAWLGLEEGGLKARDTRWSTISSMLRSYRSTDLSIIRHALKAYSPRSDLYFRDAFFNMEIDEPLPLPKTLGKAAEWKDEPMKAVADKWFIVLCNMMDPDRDFVMWGAETNSVFDEIMIRASFNYFYVIAKAVDKGKGIEQVEPHDV